MKINIKTSALLRALHQEAGVPCAELVRRYPQYSRRSIYRHARKSEDTSLEDRRKHNKGRPRILSVREERLIIRTLMNLRRHRASFTAKRIQEEAGLQHVSIRTIQRVLHRHGYKYKQSRKKGLLSCKDKKRRLQFAKDNKEKAADFWTKHITFYFDGVGFAHRSNPYEEARTVSSMAWRKPGEGLQITTKGRKEGSGGRMARFFVAIAHGYGVVLCHHHDWKVTGPSFAQFVLECFPGVNTLYFFKVLNSNNFHYKVNW